MGLVGLLRLAHGAHVVKVVRGANRDHGAEKVHRADGRSGLMRPMRVDGVRKAHTRPLAGAKQLVGLAGVIRLRARTAHCHLNSSLLRALSPAGPRSPRPPPRGPLPPPPAHEANTGQGGLSARAILDILKYREQDVGKVARSVGYGAGNLQGLRAVACAIVFFNVRRSCIMIPHLKMRSRCAHGVKCAFKLGFSRLSL